MSPSTRSTAATSARSSAPRSADSAQQRVPAGYRRTTAGHGPVETGRCRTGSGPRYPGQSAPNAGAPARCSRASRRPNSSAAVRGRRYRSRPTRERAGRAARRSPPVPRPRRSPAATPARPPRPRRSPPARARPGQLFVKIELPSSRVSREARQMLPPGTGVSRIRWWVRKVGSRCGCARRYARSTWHGRSAGGYPQAARWPLPIRRGTGPGWSACRRRWCSAAPPTSSVSSPSCWASSPVDSIVVIGLRDREIVFQRAVTWPTRSRSPTTTPP